MVKLGLEHTDSWKNLIFSWKLLQNLIGSLNMVRSRLLNPKYLKHYGVHPPICNSKWSKCKEIQKCFFFFFFLTTMTTFREDSRFFQEFVLAAWDCIGQANDVYWLGWSVNGWVSSQLSRLAWDRAGFRAWTMPLLLKWTQYCFLWNILEICKGL